MSGSVQRHLAALNVAQKCLGWGARLHTIHEITGLNRHILRQLAIDHNSEMPNGRPADGAHWYAREPSLGRAEACIFTAQFVRLRAQKFDKNPSLLNAYRCVFEIARESPRLSFDQAFDLAAKVDEPRSRARGMFENDVCRECGCNYIKSMKGKYFDCPFCKLFDGFREPALHPKTLCKEFA